MPLRPASLALSLLLLGPHAQGAEQADANAEAAAVPPQETRAPLLERSQADARALERQLPEPQQQHLEADGEAFLALWRPAHTDAPQGTVILLPGAGESADWPRSVGPLRRKLPASGWHSLSLSLPDAPSDAAARREPGEPAQDDTPADVPAAGAGDNAPLAATPAAELGSAEAGAAAPTPTAASAPRQGHAVRVLARIDAAVAFAERQQAQPVVLLGHGSGAYWAARYLAERRPAQIRHLLLVAAAQPPGLSPGLEELIADPQPATGDFYYRNQARDRDAAHARLLAGQRQSHPAYSQVALDVLPGNPAIEQEQLFRRLRGWLERQRQGDSRASQASGRR
ncbi:alpha/beta hydrolase family protein [Pseudomonas lalucatii]|uniref:Alpha/beta hydrolase family protein n=1 Tax=Pseudomonas lalucatii TaxID=1424203 RepID=A0ABS5Q7E8_9PSED|nr:alpha/beta hydrolase family protein [Pseudomonas lalucatii]MBS7664203.1 alpha/beta hydrolase family protein [Pseudomonas lalucatii]